jgi:hypothetical protein
MFYRTFDHLAAPSGADFKFPVADFDSHAVAFPRMRNFAQQNPKNH